MSISKKKYLYILTGLFFSNNTFARSSTVGEMFYNTGSQLSTTGELFRMICYLIGLVLGIFGVLKIKEYSDNPGKMSIKEPLIRLLAGGFFIALPTLIYIIIESTVGSVGSLNVAKDIGGLGYR